MSEEIENLENGEKSSENSVESAKTLWTYEEVESIKKELNDKHLRLLAEFDNYKRRVNKEKEDLKMSVKSNVLSSILDFDSDITLAKKSGRIGAHYKNQSTTLFSKCQQLILKPHNC